MTNRSRPGDEEALAVAHFVAGAVQRHLNLDSVRFLVNALCARSAADPIHHAIPQPCSGLVPPRCRHEEGVVSRQRLEPVRGCGGAGFEAGVVLRVCGRRQRMMTERALLHGMRGVPLIRNEHVGLGLAASRAPGRVAVDDDRVQRMKL